MKNRSEFRDPAAWLQPNEQASILTTHAPSPPAEPFTIGLKPLANDNFLIVDDSLPRHLAEKRELHSSRCDDIFMAEGDTLEEQAHIAEMVVDCLKSHHRRHYVFDGDLVSLRDGNGRLCDPAKWSHAPLAGAALCIQDDLVLMRDDE